MKILITGGKTATALKLLKAFNSAEIFLGDYGDMPNINASSYSFIKLGVWNADVLAHNLLTKCLDNGVNVLLPLYEAEIEALSKSLVLFEEFGLKVLVPVPKASLWEKTQLNKEKFDHWCVVEKGKLLYASVEKDLKEKDYFNLNGAYHFNDNTDEFGLISIPNP